MDKVRLVQYLDRNNIGAGYFLTRPTLVEDFVIEGSSMSL